MSIQFEGLMMIELLRSSDENIDEIIEKIRKSDSFDPDVFFDVCIRKYENSV